MKFPAIRPWVPVALLFGALAATAQEPITQDEETTLIRPVRWEEVDDADGEVLFANLCAACHGESAHGDGPVAEALGTQFPDLTLLAQRNHGRYPLHRVEDVIHGKRTKAHGNPRMPVWGPSLMAVRDDWPESQRKAFVANRLRKLAEYLESLQAPAPDDSPPGP
jgi:mono/diheme cytochrome c family protein